MCGIAGYVELQRREQIDPQILHQMTKTIRHRGPDSVGYWVDDHVGLGFRRLSIIDLEGGDQPIQNEDGSLILICNGEIYNHRSLRQKLIAKGHSFRTHSDVEVLLHLYEEHGVGLFEHLNGQFAFVLYDRTQQQLLIARDHMGIAPLYYTKVGHQLIFGSEIKAILAHPAVPRGIDFTSLDQILSFPGLASPRTMFENIESLPNGHYLLVKDGDYSTREYWDLCYPEEAEAIYDRSDEEYIDELSQRLLRSVDYRLQADVPVGFYLSGGLDSSLIGALIQKASPDLPRRSFSIRFAEKSRDESKYQEMVTAFVNTETHQVPFDGNAVADRLIKMIYHAECPVKESYNTCFLALSEAVHAHDYKVILTGEGADEIFAGYVGYRFDAMAKRGRGPSGQIDGEEAALNERLWGDHQLFYEKRHADFRATKQALYSVALNQDFAHFDCLNFPLVNKAKLTNRDRLHRRSYLDYKLRMVDHLLIEHGDHMAMANSVEARYPFLDIELVDFVRQMPPHLKLNGLTEKYALRQVAEPLLPAPIVRREKYGWHSASGAELLKRNLEWVNDLLSTDRIQKDGYFNPDTVEQLKKKYTQPNFRLNLPFDDDLLMTVLTFNLFTDVFKL
ncbi:MAG: asparagine synthase (glutamine-hydrolyzing) [Chloroflexota bacterium]